MLQNVLLVCYDVYFPPFEVAQVTEGVNWINCYEQVKSGFSRFSLRVFIDFQKN
jgi:hypothetical protein